LVDANEFHGLLVWRDWIIFGGRISFHGNERGRFGEADPSVFLVAKLYSDWDNIGSRAGPCCRFGGLN